MSLSALVDCCSRNTWLAGDWKEASRTEDKAGERFDESSLGKIPYPARFPDEISITVTICLVYQEHCRWNVRRG
jgi:hypothetical protein